MNWAAGEVNEGWSTGCVRITSAVIWSRNVKLQFHILSVFLSADTGEGRCWIGGFGLAY